MERWWSLGFPRARPASKGFAPERKTELDSLPELLGSDEVEVGARWLSVLSRQQLAVRSPREDSGSRVGDVPAQMALRSYEGDTASAECRCRRGKRAHEFDFVTVFTLVTVLLQGGVLQLRRQVDDITSVMTRAESKAPGSGTLLRQGSGSLQRFGEVMGSRGFGSGM